jgi:hypothetical protein
MFGKIKCSLALARERWIPNQALQFRLTFLLRLTAGRKEGSLACGEKSTTFFILAARWFAMTASTTIGLTHLSDFHHKMRKTGRHCERSEAIQKSARF